MDIVLSTAVFFKRKTGYPLFYLCHFSIIETERYVVFFIDFQDCL